MFYTAIALLTLATPVFAQNHACSNATGSGDWAYSYSGSIVLPTGLVPVASTGRFTGLPNGTLTGSQTRSNGGDVAVETIGGTFSVKRDCTESFTVNVYQSGVLVRSATLAVVLSNNGRMAYGIFSSLTLSDGTALPTVITIQAQRVFTAN
jgi:hypothetical protein